ncbi:MAG TPA: ABC transporter substrate-binding protein [Dehalococcoidia bacterium]|nr:ABC transporter substrate-binding protein [Dehalococcoidia bacterium]
MPQETSKSAKPGGTLKDFLTADIQHFDATISERAAVAGSFSAWCYPRMLKYKLATYPDLGDGTSVGDAATAYEISGDKMQITFKIRQGMKWDSRAPTNGRALDAQDVLFSWKKFAELNPAASNLANARSPSAAVTSVEAPDNQTIVVKLVRPDATVIPGFTAFDHFYVMPRESAGGFDPMVEVRGAGPWQVEEFVPSARMVYRRNSDYYESGRPYPDRLECPIIADYSQLLAQFKSGNIYTNVALPQDAIQTKKDSPNANMIQTDRFLTAGNYLTFGYDGASIFRDKRMRQALSLTIDAEGYVEGVENRSAFESQGVDLEWARNTAVWAGWGDYWLDPDDKDAFGDNNKYLHLNIEESKALMSAAGFPQGAEFTFGYSSERYGAIYLRNADVFAGMFREAGMKVNQDAVPYQKYQEVYSRDGNLFAFNGVTMRAGRAWGSVAAQLFGTMHKDGSIYHGMSANNSNYEQGDPKVNDLTEKIKLEYDTKKQEDLVHQLIRYVTGEATAISQPATSKAYTVTWPALGNFGVFTSYPGGAKAAETMINYWIDSTKPPLA